MPLIVPLIIIAVIVIFFVAYQRSVSADEQWRKAADQLQLDFEGGGVFSRPKIIGMVDGFIVHVKTVSRGSGKSNRTYTAYEVAYPRSLDFPMTLSKQGMFSGIRKLFGGRDVEIGDPSFDPEVIIDTEQDRAAASFLTPVRRMRIHQFFESYANGKITDEAATWEVSGRVADADALVAAIRSGVQFAQGLYSRDPLEARVSDALGGRDMLDERAMRERETAAAFPSLHARSYAIVPDAADSESVVTDPMAPQRSASEETIAQPAVEAEPFVPTDESVSAPPAEVPAERSTLPVETPPEPAPATEISEMPAETEPPADSAAASANVAPVGEGLDIPSVIAELFGSELSSYDVTAAFEKRYAGHDVNWEGTVRRVENFAVDLVFGAGPGKKATVEIGEAPQAFGGTKPVSAIVRLADGEADPEAGARYSFSGRLVKLDGFMHNVYVAPPEREG